MFPFCRDLVFTPLSLEWASQSATPCLCNNTTRTTVVQFQGIFHCEGPLHSPHPCIHPLISSSTPDALACLGLPRIAPDHIDVPKYVALQGVPKAEPTMLALGVDGGFRTDEQKYDVVKTHRVVVFKAGAMHGFTVKYPDEVRSVGTIVFLIRWCCYCVGMLFLVAVNTIASIVLLCYCSCC